MGDISGRESMCAKAMGRSEHSLCTEPASREYEVKKRKGDRSHRALKTFLKWWHAGSRASRWEKAQRRNK